MKLRWVFNGINTHQEWWTVVMDDDIPTVNRSGPSWMWRLWWRVNPEETREDGTRPR